MFKIAHISDLHIRLNDENKLKDKFVNLMESISNNGCNHLIITGDISDSSDVKELKQVKSILKKYKFDTIEKLSVTIGNHDIFGGAKKGPEVYLFPTECKNTNYNSKVRNFSDIFTQNNELKSNHKKGNIFPILKKLSTKIVLISINSVAKWSVDLNPIASNGIVDTENLTKLKIILKSKVIKDKFKIVLIHHNFKEPEINSLHDSHSLWLYSERNTMKLHNKNDLITLFDRYSVNLILHGHTHKTESYKINRNKYLNSSGCMIPFTDDRLHKYHIISFPDSKSNPFKFKTEIITI